MEGKRKNDDASGQSDDVDHRKRIQMSNLSKAVQCSHKNEEEHKSRKIPYKWRLENFSEYVEQRSKKRLDCILYNNGRTSL